MRLELVLRPALLLSAFVIAGALQATHSSAAAPTLGLPPLPESDQADPAVIDLGRRLFFDRRLSDNGTLSCGMCHIPEQGFTQNELATPIGVEGRSVRRNAPSLYNVAYLGELFHDGRERSLERQIWSPLLAANEMANVDRQSVIGRILLLDDYPDRFAALYPAGLTERTLGHALASYQRTLIAADSAFDRWYFGGGTDALDRTAKRGFQVFQSVGCPSCHTFNDAFALFTDGGYHNTGIGHRSRHAAPAPRSLEVAPGVVLTLEVKIDVPGRSDNGREEVTGAPADRWRYRTPSLRNVALTGPYMHDGSLTSLAEVIDYYDAGGSGDPDQDPRIQPLDLSAEDKAALSAFLNALTSSNVAALTRDARSAPIGDRR